ncbi:MAG: pectinacetylesterase family protein, partial [Sandaracinaceae bacterium]|nr:pectinacetylesterase family protein [Sandaracinaceae bacterium]
DALPLDSNWLSNEGGTPFDAGAFRDGGPDGGGSTLWSRLPSGRWSAVVVEGALCGNGSAYRVGINPFHGSEEMVILLMGGGACWNASTCFGLRTAAHIDEDYTEALLFEELALFQMARWDDRSLLDNPFRNAHMIFMPYCTGDLHAGNAVQTYPGASRSVHHKGAVNLGEVITKVREAWPSLRRIWVVGISAGGYGVQIQGDRFAESWRSADIALLADSAPLLDPGPTLYMTWREAWNMYTPPLCTECATRWSAYNDFLDERFSNVRLGIISTTRDSILRVFYGRSIEALYPGLFAALDDNSRTRYFVIDSDEHVLLPRANSIVSSDGLPLRSWLSGWVAGNFTLFRNTRP